MVSENKDEISLRGKLWRCFLMSHLKASDSEPASIVGGGDDGNQVGAFRNVLVIELYGHLIVAWGEKRSSECP